MFKTPRNYEYDDLTKETQIEYKISPNDRLNFRLFTNDGFKLIDLSSGDERVGGTTFTTTNVISYLVELDGTVELPTIGKVDIQGLTIYEAQSMLEEKYAQYYKKPFVMLNVINRRVTVSTGTGGTARVINLENNNVTLIEALAQAGGIADRGNASRVKLIRRKGEEVKVFKLDLSTIEGAEYSKLIVQANDIIYVEPTPQIASELLRDVAPIVALISSAVFIVSVLNTQ